MIRGIILGTLGALAVVVAGAYWWRPSLQSQIAAARLELAQGRLQSAESLAERILARQPQNSAALLIAGEAATKEDRFDDAVAYYDRVPEGAGDASVAVFAAADVLLHRGRLSAAEERLRRVLTVDPQHAGANNRMAFVLGIEGRRWESARYLLELVRQDRFSVEQLLLLGNLEQNVDLPEAIAKFREETPDEVLPLLGRARSALRDNDLPRSEGWLREVIAKHPQEWEAQARLGGILQDRSEAEFLDWHHRLGPGADSHPEIWIVRGQWAQRNQQSAVAARCFWEAARIDPNHRVAHYQLSQALSALGRSEAEAFARRAAKLEEIASTLNQIYSDRDNAGLLRRAALQMEQLGRIWEAWGWHRAALALEPRSTLSQRELARLGAFLQSENPPQTLKEACLALQFDLSQLPRPEWSATNGPSREPAESGTVALRFEDEAARTGIDFRYFNSDDSSTEGMRMFEFTGGGVGVGDFDRDGWPDLYLSQGCPFPETPAEHPYRDRLFRNRSGERFDDVSAAAGVEDARFSQGVAVGDIDGDGFPDLFVSNIGPNRLYRNNGDGTFEDVTEIAGVAGDDWSTSAALADLNGDGLADLYVVNYLAGSLALTEICRKDGVARACTPVGFDAAQDRCYLNLSNGRFDDVTATAGMEARDGKGLGIVTADLQGDGRLAVFVANDAVPNFLFLNQQPRGARPQFVESAWQTGVAVDSLGQSQACMGVAAGDADEDGRLDLFVTNFHRESNTLYLQRSPLQFTDATRQARLADPSFLLLGFGTQFLDADLDGHRDLVVANGHVDDFSYLGEAYQMPPQLFRNLGGAKFSEIHDETPGSYFAGRYLGRALARLDWNRDGRDDFGVMHLDAPFSLVTNRSPSTGSFLSLSLHGVESARDAIGTVVTIKVGDRTLVEQLTAGDGYQASNERCVRFGLGSAERIESVNVRWPSGREQQFRDVDANRELILVEGHELRSTAP